MFWLSASPGGRRSPEYLDFAARFQGRFQYEPRNLAEFAYDAVYMLAYAIMSTNEQAPSGTEIAAGLPKTSCKDGTRIAAGTRDWQTGLSTITSKGCINYYGPSGELDFDANGDTVTDISGGCLQGPGQYAAIDTYYSIAKQGLTPTKGVPLELTDPTWCKPFTP